MATSDVTVANLPPVEAPAPEPAKKPDPPKRDFFTEDIYEPTYDHSDDKVPVAVETPPAPEAATPTPEPKPTETPAAPKHSQEDLQAAQQLGFPADVVDEWSPAVLNRVVKEAHRVAQLAWEAAKQHGQTQSPTAETKAEEEPFLTADEEKWIDPEAAKVLENKFKKRDAALSDRDKKIAQLEQKMAAMEVERINSRLDGIVREVGPEAAKVLDRSTAAGQKAFHKLLNTMDGLALADQRSGEARSEKELLASAVRAMGIATGGGKGADQDARVEAALAQRAKEHDEGALSKPTSREGDESYEDAVRRILQRRNMPVARPEEQTVWEPD